MSEPALPAEDAEIDGARAPRADSRREAVVAAAAELFARKGYDAVSMRDIAKASGMLSGSIYYHFPSKDDLFAEVHARTVARIHARLDAALDGVDGPWPRLEAALSAHVEGLLESGEAAATVLSADLPLHRVDLSRVLVAQRDAYEARLRALVEGAVLREGVDPRLFRLFLLGAANWMTVWFRPGGGVEPGALARALADLMRRGAEPRG